MLTCIISFPRLPNQVVDYAAFNEEEIKAQPRPTATPMQKLWEEIIPADEREKAEVKKLKDMELKPRSRKTVEKVSVFLSLNKC